MHCFVEIFIFSKDRSLSRIFLGLLFDISEKYFCLLQYKVKIFFLVLCSKVSYPVFSRSAAAALWLQYNKEEMKPLGPEYKKRKMKKKKIFSKFWSVLFHIAVYFA